jgi:hypothetical protein
VPLTPDEIDEVIALGHELRHVEFKGSGDRTDKAYQAVIARAVMAMGNLPDGGHVVLGVAETKGQLSVEGLSDAQLAQWTDHDEVADAISRFSDPLPTLHLSVVTLRSCQVIDVEVEPFDDTPYLCRRDSPGVLQAGRMYVRRVGKAETGNPTHHELREVLDRAAARRVRSLISILGAAGVEALGIAPAGASAKYAEERESVAADAERMAFETLGHWAVEVYPADYVPDRVSRPDLAPVIEAATVRLRGWPVPFIDHEDLLEGQRYVGCETDDDRHVEAWRFFTSGQYYEKRAFSAEAPARKRSDGPMVIDIWDIIFHATEIYALAVRLAEGLPDVSAMTISLALDALYKTELRSEPERELWRPYRTDESRIEDIRTVPVGELIPRAEELALDAAFTLLSAFGLNVGRQVLEDYQQNLLRQGGGSR